MRAKVCILRCPAVTLPYPPDLGMAYVNSVLADAGIPTTMWDINWEVFLSADKKDRDVWRIKVYDVTARHGLDMIERFKPRLLQKLEALLTEGYNVFGFSVWWTNYEASVKFAGLIKQQDPRAFVIFGGPECMPDWSGRRAGQESDVDAVVYGEGERTMLDLVRTLETGGRFRPCAGSLVNTPDGLLDGGMPAPIDPMSLPPPDFGDFDFHGIERRFPLAFNRGCVWSCNFCNVPGYIPTFRWRPAEHIFQEIRLQTERYGATEFIEYSPTMNSNMRELNRLCDLLIEHRMGLRWEGFGIFHRLMTTGIIQKLRKAGCHTINFGMESGSQRVLDSMGKKFQIPDAERILRDLKDAGIHTCLNFVVGYPGETEDDFQKSLAFAERNAECITMTGCVAVLSVSPYSSVYSDQDKWGIVMEHPNTPYGWRTRDNSNTLDVRLDRKKRFEALASALGILQTGDTHYAGTEDGNDASSAPEPQAR